MSYPLAPDTSDSATLYHVGQQSVDGLSIVVQKMINGEWTHLWEPTGGGGVTTINTSTGTPLTNVAGVVTLPPPTTVVDALTSTSTAAALSANQGKLLNDADIANISIIGSNLVVTLKGGATKTLDISALQLDIKLVSAVYKSATKTIEFKLSDGSTISMPAAALLPVTTDATLSGDGSTTPLKVELSTDAGNALVYGTDGKIKVLVPPPGSFWTSSTAAANTPAIPDGATDLTEKLRRDGFVGLGVDPVTALDVAGGIINRPLALKDQSVSGALVAADITNNSLVSIAQTTPNISVTIPAPTVSQSGRYLRVANNGTTPLIVGGITILAKSFGDFIWDGTNWEPESVTARLPLQPLLENDGCIKHSLSNEIRWTNRLIVMTTGTTSRMVSGYYDIYFPADGFAIPVAGGGTRTVVGATAGNSGATGGILLTSWESLWYRIPEGSSNTFVPGNLLIQPYPVASKLTPDDGWVLIASFVSNHSVKWFNGDHTSAGTQFGGSLSLTIANWTAMRSRAQGSGYFFSPGGNTTSPKSFGFTGAIRWIDGGTSPYINSQGYVDTNPASRAAGKAVIGYGTASRVWRLMTASEKPEWFGGAINAVCTNRIDPTSTTVVDLVDNEALFWAPPIDGTGVDTGNWFVMNYSSGFNVPIHWLPVASYQVTGANSTIQILIGGVTSTIRAGETRWMGKTESNLDMLHKKCTHTGIKYCRATTTGFFNGTAANGDLGTGTTGVMVSWDDGKLIYGISDGNINNDNYTWINVPATGTAIPVVTVNSAVTRVVQTIGSHRYIPLASWEALYYIPPALCGGTTSIATDFVICNYNGVSHIPDGAVLIAKNHNAFVGVGADKSRVLFADGTYMQPGLAVAVGTIAEYDHAQGSGDWRSITVAGSTPPSGTSPLPTIAGVKGGYPGQFAPVFRYEPISATPQGTIRLSGLIELNGSVATGSTIAFIPGVQATKINILTTHAIGGIGLDPSPVLVSIRTANATIGGQVGTTLEVLGSLNTASSNWTGKGTPLWISLDGLVIPHA